jgi:uncharacterized protein YkwD
VSVAKKVFLLLGTGICASVLAAPGTASPTRAEASVIGEINRVRAQHGLVGLRIDLRLERAARAKSVTTLRTGVFAHGDVRRRLASFGARGPVVGENLAWGTGSRSTAAGIVQGWLASPSHRANLLRPGFRRIGVGRVVGTFHGYGGAVIVTANFAGR